MNLNRSNESYTALHEVSRRWFPGKIPTDKTMSPVLDSKILQSKVTKPGETTFAVISPNRISYLFL